MKVILFNINQGLIWKICTVKLEVSNLGGGGGGDWEGWGRQ